MSAAATNVIPMHDLMSRAATVSRAPAAQQAMFIAAARVVIYPQPPCRCTGKGDDGILTFELDAGHEEFMRFILAEEFEAAACTLLPKGWKFAELEGGIGPEVVLVDESGIPRNHASAATLGLAIAAASCVAHHIARGPFDSDSGSDRHGENPERSGGVEGEASQSGGAEGAASPTLSSRNPETPNDR